jgi:hypothetical protein
VVAWTSHGIARITCQSRSSSMPKARLVLLQRNAEYAGCFPPPSKLLEFRIEIRRSRSYRQTSLLITTVITIKVAYRMKDYYYYYQTSLLITTVITIKVAYRMKDYYYYYQTSLLITTVITIKVAYRMKDYYYYYQTSLPANTLSNPTW